MGWWETEQADVTIGDVPVDQLANQLRGVVETRAAGGLERPTVGAFLAALADGLRRRTTMWCGADENTPFDHMLARVEDPDGAVTLVTQDAAVDSALADQISEAFEDIVIAYDDAFDRQPKRAELVAVVAFLLSADPDNFLDLPAGSSVVDVTISPAAG
jgi:hypothetical protein